MSTSIPVVTRNRDIYGQFSNKLTKCPACLGHGVVRIEHSGEYESCLYCRGRRVVEKIVTHQHYHPDTAE